MRKKTVRHWGWQRAKIRSHNHKQNRAKTLNLKLHGIPSVTYYSLKIIYFIWPTPRRRYPELQVLKGRVQKNCMKCSQLSYPRYSLLLSQPKEHPLLPYSQSIIVVYFTTSSESITCHLTSANWVASSVIPWASIPVKSEADHVLLTHPNCNRATDWSKVAAADMPVRDVEKDKSCLSVAMLFDERWGVGTVLSCSCETVVLCFWRWLVHVCLEVGFLLACSL